MCLSPIQMIRKLKEGSESCLSLLEVIRAKTFFFFLKEGINGNYKFIF